MCVCSRAYFLWIRILVFSLAVYLATLEGKKVTEAHGTSKTDTRQILPCFWWKKLKETDMSEGFSI